MTIQRPEQGQQTWELVLTFPKPYEVEVQKVGHKTLIRVPFDNQVGAARAGHEVTVMVRRRLNDKPVLPGKVEVDRVPQPE